MDQLLTRQACPEFSFRNFKQTSAPPPPTVAAAAYLLHVSWGHPKATASPKAQKSLESPQLPPTGKGAAQAFVQNPEEACQGWTKLPVLNQRIQREGKEKFNPRGRCTPPPPIIYIQWAVGGLLLLLCLRNSLASQQHWGKLGLWRSLVRRQEIQRGGEPGPVGGKCREPGGWGKQAREGIAACASSQEERRW